jgi:hypothetical protein
LNGSLIRLFRVFVPILGAVGIVIGSPATLALRKLRPNPIQRSTTIAIINAFAELYTVVCHVLKAYSSRKRVA